MVNLPALAARLQDAGIISKSFLDCTREEIMTICEAVYSCPDPEFVPASGWAKPIIYRTEDGRTGLSIPLAAHPKYRWWTPDGQSVEQTLIELQAPFDIAKNYILHITEDEWNSKLSTPPWKE